MRGRKIKGHLRYEERDEMNQFLRKIKDEHMNIAKLQVEREEAVAHNNAKRFLDNLDAEIYGAYNRIACYHEEILRLARVNRKRQLKQQGAVKQKVYHKYHSK